MTAIQTSLLPPTPGEERDLETDTAERGDDPTPRGVIRAALKAAICYDLEEGPVVGCDPSDTHGGMESGHVLQRGWYGGQTRVLDVGAGYGAWSSELRRLAQAQGWPVHITGVEIHEPRREHMLKWCDEAFTGVDWREFADLGPAFTEHSYDLAIGNPPFDELTGPKGAKRPPEECMPAVLLRHAPAVLLLHTQQAFLKSAAGRACWRAYPPAASWLVPGGVKFRGPDVGADSRCYQVTLWLRDHTGPCSVYMLDDLSPAERSWTVPPGTEEPSKCEVCEGQGGSEEAGDCPDCDGSGLDPNGDLPSAPGYQP